MGLIILRFGVINMRQCESCKCRLINCNPRQIYCSFCIEIYGWDLCLSMNAIYATGECKGHTPQKNIMSVRDVWDSPEKIGAK